MVESLKDAVQFMLDNGYLAVIRGKYVVTAKFNKEVTGVYQGAVLLKGNIPAVVEPKVPKTVHWRDQYIAFVNEVKIPPYGHNSRGERYQMNAFSEDGVKAYRNAIEKEDILHPLLVEATQMYYHGSVAMKVGIGKFMSEGMWRTFYNELVEIKNGKLQKPKEHASKWKSL
jgi:hypothetical protein